MKVQADDFEARETLDGIQIFAKVDPISLQATPARKRAFREALGAAVERGTKGVFTHDVEVTLVWYIEEERRYETHLVADLDNVMKPLLDALTGPQGVLIDDNQVQSIKSYWVTPGHVDVRFELRLESLNRDDYVSRHNLRFVEFSPRRCYLLHGSLNEDLARDVVHAFRVSLEGFRTLTVSALVRN